MAKFNPGERVTDLQTGKNGVILDVCQPQRGRQLYRVLFENIAETKLEQNLETFFEQDNPFACLKKGLYGNRDQFMLINTTYKINNSNNNTLSSLKASKTLFKAYQFKPLLKFVNSPTQRILIADEVGLGKTIEAGHILLELKARDEFKTALIVCPNSLKIKWQTELKEKFGLAFKIYDSLDDVIEDLKAHPQNARGILNYEKIRVKESDETEEKSNDLIEFLNSNGQKYSIVLCDEAHKLRNDDTLSYKGMTGILEVTDAAIFLTATPLMLGENDLYNLLHLLEPLYYDNQNVFQNSINANKPFVKALAMLNAGESLHQIKELLSTDIITQRQVIGKNDYLTKCTVQEQYSGIPLYEKIINSLEEPDSLSLRARLQDYISSISPINNVFSRTRKREISTDERQQTERDAHKCSVILSDEERKIFDEIIDSYIEPNSVTFETEDGEEKVFYTGSSLGLIQQKRMVSSSVFGCKFYTENPGDVAAFCAQVEKESAVKDAKIECLVNIFDGIRQTQSSKVIVFSIFKFTVRYLSIRLKKIGYETFVIHGDIPIDEREKIIQEFKRSKKFAVLLATEVGSEGLDLQFCAHLVNYDLPWNPMVVEQRIGRIDRFGQKAPKVNIYNFVVYDSIQEEIYTRLLERIGIFQGAIGELEMILEENDDFKQLEKDFYGTNLSPEAKEQKFRDIEKAIETQKIQLEQVEKGMVNTLTNDIYFQNEINKIRSYRLYVTEDELRNYIQMLVSEHLTTCNFRALNDNEYVFTVPKSEQRALDSFLLKNQPQGEDFANLFGNYRRQIMDNMQENGECVLTFDQSYAFDNKAIDFVNIYNPIIIAASVYFKKNLERIGKTFRLKYNAPAHIPIEKGLYCMAVYSVSVHRNVYGKQVSSDRLVPILYSVKEDCIIENEDLAMQIFGEIQEKATYLSPDEDIENFNECTLDGIESDFCDHISSFVNREIESLRLKDESLRVIQKRQEEEYYDTRIRKEEQNIVDIKYELEQLEDSTNAIKKLQLAENRLNLIKAKRDNALEKINSVQTPTMESKLVSLSKLLIF